MHKRHIVVLGVALAYLVTSFADFDLAGADFRSFYESSEAWLLGQPMYSMAFRPNLNPPWFAVLLVPLVPLGLAWAFVAWTAIGVALTASTCLLILRRRPNISPVVLLVAVATFLPAWTAWRHGQVTWIVFALITRAWLSESPVKAGLWLAPAVMLKPYLAVMALVLPWPIALVAGVASFAGTLLGVVALGWPLWREWLALSGQINWFGNFANVSLWGHATRFYTGQLNGPPVLGFPGWIIASVLMVGAVLAVQAMRRKGDARWASAFLLGSLLSPLGWVYALPAGAGPIIASVRHHPAAWLIVAACAVPNIVYCVWWKMGGNVALWTAMILPCAILILWRLIGRSGAK